MESIERQYAYWENRQLEVDTKQNTVARNLARLDLSGQLEFDMPGITTALVIPFPVRQDSPEAA